MYEMDHAAEQKPGLVPSDQMAELILRGVDIASVGICVTHPEEGRFLYVNETVSKLLGRPREELLSLTIQDVTRPEDHPSLHAARRAMNSGELRTYQAERSYLRPDGTSLWAVIRVTPIRDAHGTVRAFFSHLVDVTERKQREERLASYTSDAMWLGRIRDALDESRLLLYAQPIVDLRTGETVQRELLLRMQGEDGRIVAPGDFLPVAERYGLIAEIDRWVIRNAARLAGQGMHVEFNLSASSIANPDVLRELECQLQPGSVDPSLLVVEVTETAMIDRPADTRALAQRLASLGCGLALDDFGTGFATLSMLKHMPAGYLKIDREFVHGVADDETDQRLVRAIVGLARDFGMTTIAEGVEDLETVATLRGLGVDCAQGYVFARPSPLVNAMADPITVSPTQGTTGPNATATVRAALEAFGRRDLDAARRLSHPSLVLRPLWTHAGSDHDGVYRGHDGLARYFSKLPALADQLEFRPGGFWELNDAVIVFGCVISATRELRVVDAMCVCRLRDGRIVSVQMFEQPDLERAPITQNGW